MRSSAPLFRDPEGEFLDHDAIEQAIDSQLGFQRVDADAKLNVRLRTTLALRPGVPSDVRITGTTLEVA